jgi:tubulin polyglutamylase TTLL9
MDFFPISYLLPSEYNIFLEEYKKYSNDKCLWIMKPVRERTNLKIFINFFFYFLKEKEK